MKKTLTLFALALITIGSVTAQTTNWKTDAAHSAVKFNVTHLVISEVEGNFTQFDGFISSNGNDFTDATINFTVEAASVNTDNEMRDGHLKSDDFFNAEKFPKLSFKSVSMKKGNGNNYTLTGDLTIRDVTKRVLFDVKHGGVIKDGYGNIKAGFKATATINRFDYNLKWNSLTEGVAVVGPDVNIILNLQFAQQK